MGIDPFVDVRLECLALLPGDAAKLDTSFTAVLELAVNQHVHLGLAGNPFRMYVVVGECLVLEVLQQFLLPRGVTLSAIAATGSGAGTSSLADIAEP
jgi:hypothetical protein